MTIQLTKTRSRWIIAGVLALLTVALYCFFPDAFWTVSKGVPVFGALFFPFFMFFVLVSLLFEFSTKQTWVRIVVKIITLLGCLLVILYASEVLISRHFWGLLVDNPGAFFYGFCIIIAFWAFFFALIGSVPWALRATAILVALYSYVNFFCIMFRGTPFVPQDLFGLGTAADVASSYSLSFTREIAESLLAFAGVFLIAPRLKFAPLPKLKKWLVRAGALIVSLVFIMATVSKPFIVALEYEPFYWDQNQSEVQNGNLVNFVANIADATVEAPEGYSLEAVNAIAAECPSDSAGDATVRPDVIVVLGESWADIVPEGGALTSEPVTPFISSFKERENAVYGNLIVSSKGGGTSRQEFQLLTGANDEYGLHTVPFLFLVDDKLPSIVTSFNAMDYQTVALHSGTPSAWNRDTALPAMGFDSFLSEDDLDYEGAPTVRTYLRDSVMYDKALEILDEADEPTFIYAITIDTHGGYGHEDYDTTISIEEPEGSYAQTEQYLSLMHEADEDFEAFVEALEQREHPTLVLFFGDHLPNFDNSYDADVLEGSDPLWKYKTIYGAWANYDLPETTLVDSDALSLSYLNIALMQYAGLPLTGYQKFLVEGAETYPVSSIVGYMSHDGALISVEEAAETEMYRKQAIMQYNFVYDRNNMPEDFYVLRP